MRVDLVENGTPVELPLDTATGSALAASNVVTASPSIMPGWWTIGPAGLVGTATIGEADVWVKPKIPIERLIFLLGYARNGKAWRDEEVAVSEAPDLVIAFAETFARQADRAVARGVLQGYRTVEEALPVVRGRIREADQMRRRYGLAVPVEVRYDDYTVDIAENQLLLAATKQLLRLPGVPDRVRQQLNRLTRLLVDVETPVRGQLLPSWYPTRLNARYHVALRLAEMVLRGASIEQRDGSVVVNGFMIDMSRLFEDFVTAALRDSLSVHGGLVCAQDRSHLDVGGRVEIKPDIVWYSDAGTPRAVIDAKYKAEKPQGFPNADLYQMLAYCTAFDLPSGHLIYAKGNEPAQRHTVRNAGIEIVQLALDLDQPPHSLLTEVQNVARMIAADGKPA